MRLIIFRMMMVMIVMMVVIGVDGDDADGDDDALTFRFSQGFNGIFYTRIALHYHCENPFVQRKFMHMIMIIVYDHHDHHI